MRGTSETTATGASERKGALQPKLSATSYPTHQQVHTLKASSDLDADDLHDRALHALGLEHRREAGLLSDERVERSAGADGGDRSLETVDHRRDHDAVRRRVHHVVEDAEDETGRQGTIR